jgi:hypothetical protein
MTERVATRRKAEPRWDIDVEYGKQGELQIDELLEWIAKGNGRVEVKRKRILDFSLYVETACDKGRRGVYQPSGIATTRAEVWVFCLGDTGIAIMIPTALLRDALDDPSTRDKQELDGSCPTKGKLVNLAVLLYRFKKQRERQKKEQQG